MLVVGAAAAVGSAAGIVAGVAYTNTKYEKIVLELRNQNKNMSENCDKQIEATKKENKKLTEKLADLTTEVSQAKEEAKKKHQELISKMEQERKEMQAKMDRDAKATQAKIDMLLSFLNINPDHALQPAGPSYSGTQTVTEGLSGATGTQGLNGANDQMSTSQFSIVADFSDDDTEVVPDPQNPGPYINWLTALNYRRNHQASNIADEFSDDDIEVISDRKDPSSQVDQVTVSSPMNLSK